VHVQVDVDQAPPGEAPADRAIPALVMTTGQDACVDLLELVGHGAPRARPHRRLQPLAQPRVADRAGELGGERDLVAGLEEQTRLAVAQDLLVDGQAGADRHRSCAERPQHDAGGGGCAVRGGHQQVRAGQRLVLAHLLRGREAHALADRRAQRRGGRRAAVADDERVPALDVLQVAQGAQEAPQRRALLVLDVDQAHPIRRARALERLDGRRHDPVVGRVEARQEVAGRLEAREARVEAAERALDDLPRHGRGDDPLGRRVERPHVQGPRVAQGGDRDREPERVVDVADVEGRAREELLDRARDVDGQGSAARAAGQRLADGEDARAAVVGEDRVAPLADAPQALAHELLRGAGRHDHDAVPAAGELLSEALDVAVELVPGVPGVRRDLRQRDGIHHAGAG
jgi:hypothetical protein